MPSGCGGYDLCIICCSLHAADFSRGLPFLKCKAAGKLAGVYRKLVSYAGLHLEHRNDGGRYCKE